MTSLQHIISIINFAFYNNYSVKQKQKMQVIQQIAAVVPYGGAVLHKAEDVYGYSKDRTLSAYQTTKDKVMETRKGYFEFRKNVENMISNIAKETVNEILSRSEVLVGVENEKKTVENCKQVRERLQAIVETIYREHLMKSRVMTNQRVQTVMKVGKHYTVQYAVPLYINLRATLIVGKEMLLEFLQGCLNEMKLTYESSKDNVVMFVSGNFNEEKLRSKVFEGISSFKKFTVQVVNKGLEIRVDRESLVENYDKFAVNFLEMIKEVKDKSEDNIEQMKKKSKDVYQEALNRIRAKQLEIKTNMKESMPGLFTEAEATD